MGHLRLLSCGSIRQIMLRPVYDGQGFGASAVAQVLLHHASGDGPVILTRPYPLGHAPHNLP